jgi:hypothetical protein
VVEHNVLQVQLHYRLNMTYTELVQKIRDYTEVDSNVFTATIVNGFILDAEWRIQRDVDSDNNRKYATATIIAGQPYVSTPLVNRSNFNYKRSSNYSVRYIVVML